MKNTLPFIIALILFILWLLSVIVGIGNMQTKLNESEILKLKIDSLEQVIDSLEQEQKTIINFYNCVKNEKINNDFNRVHCIYCFNERVKSSF